MTKTTYKVGDKVRILDAKHILFGFDLTNGKEYEVTKMSNGGIYVIDDEGERLYILERELQHIEKVEESDAKMTQFKVGDKVRVINANASKHSNGDEGVVVSITPIWFVVFIDVDVNGVQQGHYAKDIELVSPKPTKNQRISALEKEVETLKAEVESLKAAQKAPTMTVKSEAGIAKIAERFAKMIAKEKKLTPNEQRKAIIDEAKAFVEKYSGIVKVGTTPYTIEAGDTTVKLFVNKEKRIVTAIPHLVHVNHTEHADKKFAKCNPSDVFNADIGKAIALGRALGLDVRKFEKAVQPSEVVVGMVVIHSNNANVYAIEGVHKGNRYDMRHTDGEYFGKFPMTDSIENFYDILDDTEAKY